MVKRNKRSHPFTLLEILLTIAILSMISGFFAINARGLLGKYFFKQDVSQLREYVLLARELSESYQADIELTIKRVSHGYFIQLQSDEPALKNLLTSKTLKHIQRINYRDALPLEKSKVLYSGTGWSFPRDTLEVRSKDGLVEIVEIA